MNNRKNIPKLILHDDNLDYVICPRCDFRASRISHCRFPQFDNFDLLGKECPYCGVKARVREREKKDERK